MQGCNESSQRGRVPRRILGLCCCRAEMCILLHDTWLRLTRTSLTPRAADIRATKGPQNPRPYPWYGYRVEPRGLHVHPRDPWPGWGGTTHLTTLSGYGAQAVSGKPP